MVVEFTINKSQPEFQQLQNRAFELSLKVHPNKANSALTKRDKEMLVRDSLGGVLAEYGWYSYIKHSYGDIVSYTEFESTKNQIDLVLSNKKTIEVRSSFPRNGVRFALCSKKHNFKNICKYDNLYKPSEVDKDFFAMVLFETQKEDLFESNSEEVVFYLVGGSTRAMMEDKNISFLDNLIAEDDLTYTKTDYKVIYLYNALDMHGFDNYMKKNGY